MTTAQIVEAARHHVFAYGRKPNPSAIVCYNDAQALMAAGNYTDAKARALKSLAYSVGVFHPDYLKAAPSVLYDMPYGC